MDSACDNYLLLTEKELVMLLKNGDILAFEQLYHNYKVRLYHNILKLIQTDEIAEELLQDLFVKIWIGRGNLDPDKSFKAYLFKIAENLVYDFFRKAATNKKLENHLIATGSINSNELEQQIYFKESTRVFNNAIEKLPPRRKQIYILCKVEGKSYEEVSNLLGISISTINEHIVKASRLVRKLFLLSTQAG